MRLLLMYLFAFVHINIYGQINEMKIVVKDIYYISINIYSNHNYPTMFDVVLNKNDSLLVDTSNKKNFINGILHNSSYVPRVWSSDVFIKYYGDTDFDTGNRFRNMFYELMEKNGKKEEIKLTSGEIVSITYFELKGVFVQLDKEISFSLGLDQNDNPKVNRPYIPFAITEYDFIYHLPIKHINFDIGS